MPRNHLRRSPGVTQTISSHAMNHKPSVSPLRATELEDQDRGPSLRSWGLTLLPGVRAALTELFSLPPQ